VFQVLPDRGSIAALLGFSAPPTRIALISVHPAAVRASRTVPGGLSLALAGGWLWVSRGGLADTKNAASYHLVQRFDPVTLASAGTIPLPGRPRQMAAGPTGLWVATGRRLFLLDPSTGDILRSVAVSGNIERMAVDAAAGVLYDTRYLPPIGNEVLALEERDLHTGALVATNTRDVRGFLAVNALSPVSGGVWMSFASGMLGGAWLFAARDLHQVAYWQLLRQAGGTNATATFADSGVLWVLDGQAETISCADPATGSTHAVSRVGMNLTGNVAAAGRRTYVATGSGVALVARGSRC